ncbi:unnamed protein product, partial [Mesorhabditis belari]|uniref:Uncharacterized protein n=1 Tax=Mesorhabditis belari TaxID=2138241 RepID=A0AAF3J6S6_9BILA
MRFFLLLAIFSTTAIVYSATSVAGGKNAVVFMTKLLGKVTLAKFFTCNDAIIQQVGNDLATCAANGSTIDQTTAVLGANTDSYMSTIATTKFQYVQNLTAFINCVQSCKDLSWTDWLAGTVGVALKKIVKPAFVKCTKNVHNMTVAGKSLGEIVESISTCGTAACTTDLVCNVVNATMKRSCSCTWTTCVRPFLQANSMLTPIGACVKTLTTLLPNCPSKNATQA